MAAQVGGTLARKLVLVLFALGTVGALAFGYFHHERGRRVVLETESVRGQSLAHMLRFTLESWLVDRMRSASSAEVDSTLRRIIYNVAALPEVAGVKVFDRQGQVLVSVKEERLGVMPGDPLVKQAIESRRILSRNVAAEHKLYFFVPLVGGAYSTGLSQPDVSALLVFVLDYREPQTESSRAAWRSALLAVLLVAALTVLLYLVLERLVLRPAETLVAQADRMGRGDVSVRSGLKVKSNDEIGRLSAAFDGMAERLEVEHLESQRAGEALRESEAQYRCLVENAPEAIVVLHLEAGTFIECNPAAQRLFGMTPEELFQVGLLEISPPTQPNGMLGDSYVQQAVEGGAPHFEWVHRAKDGTLIDCEIWLTRLPVEGRTLIRGSIIDIRERKRLEEQLRQLQKTESIGRLAGGVAHDFNNLLTSIMGFAELARNAEQPTGYIDRLLESASRGAVLTQQLLAFARRKIVHPESANLNDIVQRMLPLLYSLMGEDVEIEIHSYPETCPVKVDIGSMEQVIMNLCINARDAMPDGGRITIETSNVEIAEQFAAARPEMRPGRYVLLAISDTGVGIDGKMRTQIFEPFFTTKPVGKGTGLGLAMCQGIVRQADGHIALYSEVGKGTTFKIYLPMANEPIRPESVRLKPVSKPGKETILLVEDEELIRAFMQESLTQLGYQVLVAQHGKEALDLLAVSGRRVDLVITDVVMPQMGGRELVAELAKRNPDMKVLFASGYTENAIVHNGVLNPGVNFIQKPFSQAELTRMIRKLLDR